METKKCRDCGEEKSIDNFYKKSGRKNQWMPYCKPCHLTRNRKAKQRNPNTKARDAKNWKEYSSRPEVKERRRQYQREYYAERKKKDKFHSIKKSVGSRVLRTVKYHKGYKEGSVWSYLPYTPQQLKEHLESQFEEWMTWENHGEWEVDHIYPHSKLPYDTLEHPNFQKAWALENLRPLSRDENRKKSDKIVS